MDDKLDPLQKVEIALLRAEYQKRFQVMINYIKEGVGEGIEDLRPFDPRAVARAIAGLSE